MSTVNLGLAARAQHLRDQGHVRILTASAYGAVGHVQGQGPGRAHLVTVISPAHAGNGQRSSSCTCAAGRHDTACVHVYALAAAWADRTDR